MKEKEDGSGILWYWKGERPLHPDAPQLEGRGEMWLESADRASGYFTTRADAQNANARTAGVFLRAEVATDARADEHAVFDQRSWTSAEVGFPGRPRK